MTKENRENKQDKRDAEAKPAPSIRPGACVVATCTTTERTGGYLPA